MLQYRLQVFKNLAVLAFVGAVFLLFFSLARAQELSPDIQTTAKAEVLEVLSQEKRTVPGTDVKSNYQTLRVKILDGEEAGKELKVDNDYLNLKKGDIFYLTHTKNSLDGQ